MASLMENLIDVLDRESTEYEALLQLSQRKTPIIAGGDLAELQKITDEEQELVSRIHNLDKQRAGVTADIADVLNRDVNDLKLPNLITMLSARPAEQQALADSHDRLQAAVRGLKRAGDGGIRDESPPGIQGCTRDSELQPGSLQCRQYHGGH